MNTNRHPSSYRDPSGHIFEMNGIIYRQVNQSYAEDYLHLKNSGLLAKLFAKKYLVNHEEVNEFPGAGQSAWLVLKPERINTISYPVEWSFDALKDAAILHLDIMQLAISHSMILKDATPYNVQFKNGQPIFIDTLSLKRYDESQPWVAYRQFCECFLYPLLLEHYRKLYISRLYQGFPDGISAAETAALLPFKSRMSLGCWLHVFLPASITKTKQLKPSSVSFSKTKMINLVSHLQTLIRGLKFNDKSASQWNTYYAETILSEQYLEHKKNIVNELLDPLQITSALDIGSNDGYFSNLLSRKDVRVSAIDNDAPSINRLYLQCKKESLNILPLVVDITDPTPAKGFENRERSSFLQRSGSELIIALALIHHLVIAKNIPLSILAAFFSKHTKWLLIEFVPKNDPKVMAMLATREDVFTDYNEDHFQKIMSLHFDMLSKRIVPGTTRVIYLYKKNNIQHN
ncbi:MAG: class I SAM-dependent methyltransferase [Chitinophagaceae bacterium]|nr:MAG: class I SAM-dependent methyltransferase [Chitinophagaceae bacterium]